MKRLIFSIATIALLSYSMNAQQWDKYQAEQKNTPEYRQILATKKSKSSGTPKTSKIIVQSTWQTENYLRNYISRKIDIERLSNEDASKYYSMMKGTIVVIFTISFIHPNRSIESDVNLNAMFLQRASDHKLFTRGFIPGIVDRRSSPLSNGSYATVLSVQFKKATEQGDELFKSLDDIIELSITTFDDGLVVIPYKLRDIVSNLDDL